MNEKLKYTLIIIFAIVGLILMIIGNHVMMDYEGFRELWKVARHEAFPYTLPALGLLVTAYGLLYVRTKKK